MGAHVSQLHGGAHLGLLSVVFLQVASQRAEVPAAVGAVLPAWGASETAAVPDVYVYVVVDVGGGRGCQGRLEGRRGC